MPKSIQAVMIAAGLLASGGAAAEKKLYDSNLMNHDSSCNQQKFELGAKLKGNTEQKELEKILSAKYSHKINNILTEVRVAVSEEAQKYGLNFLYLKDGNGDGCTSLGFFGNNDGTHGFTGKASLRMNTKKEKFFLLSFQQDISGIEGAWAEFFGEIRSSINSKLVYDLGLGIVNLRPEKKSYQDANPEVEGSFSTSSALHYNPIGDVIITLDSRVNGIDGISVLFNITYKYL